MNLLTKVSLIFAGIIFLVASVVTSIWVLDRGLFEYGKLLLNINLLPSGEAGTTLDQFYSLGNPLVYSGTLDKVDGTNIKIWGNRGLQTFRTDNNSVFSTFSLCNSPDLKNIQQDTTPNIQTAESSLQSADLFSISEWSSKVRVGDYVNVISQKNESGLIQQIYAYDWLPFMPDQLARDILQRCKQRS